MNLSLPARKNFRLIVLLVIFAALQTAFGAGNPWNPRKVLIDAGWVPQIADSIVEKVERSEGRVIAVFDHDNTLICGDITEGKELGHAGFANEFIKKSLCKRDITAEIPASAGKDPWKFYQEWASADPGHAYGWICTIYGGYPASEISRRSAQYYKEQIQPRIFPEMLTLVKVLKDLGVDVFVVSASAQVVVRAAAPFFGIPEDHIFGIRLAEKDGILLPRYLKPISWSAGKTWYIRNLTGSFPPGNILVFGDSYRTDGHMLRFGVSSGGYSVLVNPAPELLPTLEKQGIAHQRLPSKDRLDQL